MCGTRAVQMNYRGALYLLTGVGDIVYPGLALDGLQCKALMNPLMILVKIIKLRWIHILSYDQMVSRKIN
ncbi:hypothetical protein GR697_24930, partial [Klebsiella pneumoniae]|nr:hypothetical protein [Klebsiella pneumoniae]